MTFFSFSLRGAYSRKRREGHAAWLQFCGACPSEENWTKVVAGGSVFKNVLGKLYCENESPWGPLVRGSRTSCPTFLMGKEQETENVPLLGLYFFPKMDMFHFWLPKNQSSENVAGYVNRFTSWVTPSLSITICRVWHIVHVWVEPSTRTCWNS